MNPKKLTPSPAADDDIEEFQPDFSLKEKIGKDFNINEVLNNKSIAAAQTVINDSRKDFLLWVREDLKMLEDCYASAALDPEQALQHVVGVQKAAFSIKAQAGTFGFDLGSAVAKSLYDFCENNYVVGDAKHILLIRKHIDTLKTIFLRNVSGDGGTVGKQVHAGLQRLVVLFDRPHA